MKWCRWRCASSTSKGESQKWWVLANPPLYCLFSGNKSGAIIFIDELDAIGTKRFGGEQSGDREVQRTMLELLSQLDGFSSDEKIKVYPPATLSMIVKFRGYCRDKSS